MIGLCRAGETPANRGSSLTGVGGERLCGGSGKKARGKKQKQKRERHELAQPCRSYETFVRLKVLILR